MELSKGKRCRTFISCFCKSGECLKPCFLHVSLCCLHFSGLSSVFLYHLGDFRCFGCFFLTLPKIFISLCLLILFRLVEKKGGRSEAYNRSGCYPQGLKIVVSRFQ